MIVGRKCSIYRGHTCTFEPGIELFIMVPLLPFNRDVFRNCHLLSPPWL